MRCEESFFGGRGTAAKEALIFPLGQGIQEEDPVNFAVKIIRRASSLESGKPASKDQFLPKSFLRAYMDLTNIFVETF